MPRIRTIKPEFWSDEKMSLENATTRLVFLGLISMADDAGRLVDNVKLLDGMIFPGTDDTCSAALDRLAQLGRILRYESASNQRLIQVSGWKRHQKVDHPNKYVLPGPRSGASSQTAVPQEDTGEVAKSSGNPREDLALRPTTYDQLSTSNDLRPTTTDLVSKKRRSGKRDSLGETAKKLVAELPAGARAFGTRFYRSAPRSRQVEVMQQLLATLNGGAQFKRGVKVKAGSPERLEEKCREVIAEGVKNSDKAIVVLLKKLGDVSKDSPTEKAAAEIRQEVKRDELDGARRLALADAWLADHPDVAREITESIDPAIADTPAGRILRNAAVLKAWTDAGEPALTEVHSS
jgi:hypothetical protein